MTQQMPRVSSGWLALRERADAEARAEDLVADVRCALALRPRSEIHDFGCGTGSMGRWLAPRLPGPQHWILYDRDADLLDHAAATLPTRAADGAPVTAETRECDVSGLTAADLADAALVTCSALLDLLTVDEVDRIAGACVGAGTPALLTLSVVGQVAFGPAEPIDEALVGAFNAHQRRRVGERRLLGPDAVDTTVEAFRRYGVEPVRRDSPWRLGPPDAALIREWLDGWLDAAVEQSPDLAAAAAAFADRRRAALARGELSVVVAHEDLLAGWAR
jgi:methyltransferase family protein